MKKLLFFVATLLTLNGYCGLNITGQLITKDSINIGDGTTYARITYSYDANGGITAWLSFWKNKNAYKKDKPPFATSGENFLVQFKTSYYIPADTVNTAPTSGFNGLPGKSLFDKTEYWIHQKIKDQILFNSREMVIEIVDIQR